MLAAEVARWFVWLAAFAWGAAWGSFFNVAIYRWPRGMSVVTPPSHCPGCGKNITPQYLENQMKDSLYIKAAVDIGAKRKFLSCLIIIDEDNVVKFAQDSKVQFSTYRDLTQSEEVRGLIEKEIKAVNESLSRVEQVKKFTILPKKLYEEDGEMTPTMKVKRKFINEAFGDLIEAMY